MRVAIDTNRLSDFFKGDTDLELALESYEEVLIPLPVLAELKAGFMMGNRRFQNERHLQRLLTTRGVSVLLPSRDTAEHYAALVAQLRAAGTPIPINDIWIAAIALEHHLTLITRDDHYRHIPQLLTAFV